MEEEKGSHGDAVEEMLGCGVRGGTEGRKGSGMHRRKRVGCG